MRSINRSAARSSVRIVAVVAACLVAFVATACEPPPPPDGRNLGVTVEGPTPSVVTKGQQITVTGVVTNHGSAPASAVKVTYVVATGFVVDDLSVDVGAVCAAVNSQAFACTLDAVLAPQTTVSLVAHATAGTVSGSQTHLVAATSTGSEPEVDPNPNTVTFDTTVRPALAPPESVNIGGRRNTLGTGRLVQTALPSVPSDYYTLAINTYCSDKVNGDRFQSGYVGGPCTGTPNSEFRASGYEYAIDVPQRRTSPLRVLLWDARLKRSCESSYPFGGCGDPAIDRFYASEGNEDYTFSLYSADNTPLDDNDNPVMCTKTFDSDTPFELSFLGSSRWNDLCAITPNQPSGRYLVRVRNQGDVTVPPVNGENSFGLAAVYESQGLDPSTALCDGLTDPLCPVVSGAGEASIGINSNTAVAGVGVGPIAAAHEGRQLELQLFDPGEGGSSIQVLAPTGPATWAPVAFTWSSPGVAGSPATANQVSVVGNRFNGKLLTIAVDLAGYVPPAGNEMWQVRYVFSNGVVTDRTTWQASIVDVPAT